MNRNTILTTSLAAATAVAIGLGSTAVIASSDGHDENLAAAAQSAAISAEEAMKIAGAQGTVLELEFEVEDGVAVYEAEIALEDGTTAEFLIDATTGEVTVDPEDDEDGDED